MRKRLAVLIVILGFAFVGTSYNKAFPQEEVLFARGGITIYLLDIKKALTAVGWPGNEWKILVKLKNEKPDDIDLFWELTVINLNGQSFKRVAKGEPVRIRSGGERIYRFNVYLTGSDMVFQLGWAIIEFQISRGEIREKAEVKINLN